MTQIAIVSDSHGLAREELSPYLEKADWILHAGDFSSSQNLNFFKRFEARFMAVRGNVDHGAWAQSLPQSQYITIDCFNFYMVHNREHLDIDPSAAKVHMVIFGHSHKPEHYTKDGVHYLNPGSVGSRRFNLPVTMATLSIPGNDTLPPELKPEFHHLV